MTSRWLARLTSAAFRHPLRFLTTAALLLALSWWYASRLEIRGDFVLLLPTESATAKRFRSALARKGSDASTLTVLVESERPDDNRRFVDALYDRLASLPSTRVSSVEKGPEQARAFFERWRWLFADVEDLERADCQLEQQIARQSPGYIDLGDVCGARAEPPSGTSPPSGAEPVSPLAELKRRYQERERELDRYPTGYYRTADGSVYALVIRSPASGLGDQGTSDLFARVQAAVAETVSAGFGSGLEVGYGGDIPNAIAEREALLEDVTIVSTVAIVLILTTIVIFFRSLAALPLIGAGVLLGTGLAFAIGMAAYGHLNAATSFLGSIIAGNGINYAIIYLARYREQRALGHGVETALLDAARSCKGATWLAAVVGSGAYAALLLTSFRGFSEFGLIGGSGMVLCWVSTFVVCPAAVSAHERVRARLFPAVATPRARPLEPVVFRAIGNVGERHPKLLLALAAALSIAASLQAAGYLRDPWEYDFSKLGSRSSAERGAGYWSVRADRVFQSRGSPILVLADEMANAPFVAAQVRERDRLIAGGRYVESIVTIYDRLGGVPDVVDRKLALLSSIRLHIDRVRHHLSPQDRKLADEFRPPEYLRALGPADLPELIRGQFQELDGRVGTPIYVALNRGISQSKGEHLLAIAEIIDGVRLPDGTIAANASRASVFAEMIRSMERDGPRCTLAAFLIVVVAAIGLTRRLLPAVAIIGSMICGLVWTIGVAARADVRLNFLNFVALPLTFGIGIDYATNLFERIRFSGGRVADGVASVGGPVFLCSLTTTFGYGALLFADNRALQSFGKYAIAGELASSATALLVMPAALSLWLHRNNHDHRRRMLDAQESRGSGG